MFIFLCLPLFLPSFLFNFLFRSLSLSFFSLCLSLSLLLFSFFLPSFLSFCFLLLPYLCLFASVHEKNDITILNDKVFFINPFRFLVFVLFSLSIPFSYLCFFLMLSCVSCSTSMFPSRNNFKSKQKTPFFGEEGGVATKRFC